MKDFLVGLLDWIYKKKCYFCRRSHACVKMCSECYDKLEPLALKIDRVVEGKKIYCCGVYSKELQKLIRGLKYHNQRDLAHYQAKFMYEYWQKIAKDEKFIVIPVPLHKNRMKKRKYNHMELVGEEFCKLSGYTLNVDLIKRIKDTAAQYRLKRAQRLVNLADAFEVDENAYSGGKILLIDDICTTGSTFEEMIREFKKHKIDDIVCLAATTPFN